MASLTELSLKEDLVPASSLQADTPRILREVETHGRYKVLTRDDIAVAVVMGVEEFERLRADAAVGRLMREIHQAEAELDAGNGITHEQMEQEFQSRWGQQEDRPAPPRREEHR